MPKRKDTKNGNGEGSIYRFRDKWRAELMIGVTPDGKKKRIRKIFDTRKEAAEWLAAYSGQVDHRFRFKPTTDSDRNRPVVPAQSDRLGWLASEGAVSWER